MVDNDFSYKIKDDDKTLLFIRHKEEFFGYDNVFPNDFSKELINLKDEIMASKEIIENIDYSKSNRDLRYVKNSSKIWNELGINLQKVQYLNPNYNFDEKSFDGYLPIDFYKSLITDYPTKIKINSIDDFKEIGFDALYLEFEKHNSIIFKYISLPKINKIINSSIYAHEITHVEQENAGGGITKITNEETLPIFNELLFGTKLDESDLIINQIINRRLSNIANDVIKLLNEKNISFAERLNIEKYLISTIQGIDLFNKYKDGNEKIKNEFINYINLIFLGEKVVEDMLNKFDSNFKDIEPNLKVLKR
jgi:hypothetical protein